MNFKEKRSRKTSVGIALCRREPTTRMPQVLLVKARLTYNFTSFVFGKYKPWDNDKLQYRFNNMTAHEKLLVWSCDFDQMWYHIWLKIPSADNPSDTFYTFYINCRSKFDRLISRDSGRRVRGLLNRSSQSAQLGWEIPKGRLNQDETEIDCAARETLEETGVASQDYHVLHQLNPICSSHEDENTVYVCKYFVAWTDRTFEPQLNFNNTTQISEVSDIKWTGLKETGTLVAQNKNLKKQVKLALRLFKQNVPDAELNSE